jgi:hypothetical protein
MPRRANRIAAASPMPEAPPVMTATLLGEMAEEELAESDIELLPGEKKPQSSQAWMIA